MNKIIKTIVNSIHSLNNSKFFAGIVMIMLNIGSKYVVIELSETQKQYFRNSITRQILIFSIVWMGTKDIFYSLLLTGIFVILADYLFNEKSAYCILPKSMIKLQKVVDTNDDNKVTENEIQNAIKILEKAKEKTKRENQMLFINQLKSSSESLF